MGNDYLIATDVFVYALFYIAFVFRLSSLYDDETLFIFTIHITNNYLHKYWFRIK